jgi:putative phosphoribosyl transferase
MPKTISRMILEQHIEIPAGYRRLGGILRVPQRALGVVAFAYGSGSGRFSPRNQYVGQVLEKAGLATLLLDLLEEDEADDRDMVFNIELLAHRLQIANDWLGEQSETRDLRVGYFGASTGAAAALLAAAQKPRSVSAVVCRGGRPDLAMDLLEFIQAPTLLIVGGNDQVVLQLNEKAFRWLRCEKNFAIAPKVTHLFEEPGALDEVTNLAKEWFLAHVPEQSFEDHGQRHRSQSYRLH